MSHFSSNVSMAVQKPSYGFYIPIDYYNLLYHYFSWQNVSFYNKSKHIHVCWIYNHHIIVAVLDFVLHFVIKSATILTAGCCEALLSIEITLFKFTVSGVKRKRLPYYDKEMWAERVEDKAYKQMHWAKKRLA